jgi:regulation of enolase protein 1 (concanavalin A-like superfamily)
MLKISLDESYVFDLLSIYEVKLENSTGIVNKKLNTSYQLLSDEIINQIGIDKFNQIKTSIEYEMLRNTNALVFELVDRAHESELSTITAKANYDRYLKKIAIQEKFFETEYTEIKL